jgi:hypothetical protein
MNIDKKKKMFFHKILTFLILIEKKSMSHKFIHKEMNLNNLFIIIIIFLNKYHQMPIYNIIIKNLGNSLLKIKNNKTAEPINRWIHLF